MMHCDYDASWCIMIMIMMHYDATLLQDDNAMEAKKWDAPQVRLNPKLDGG